MFFLAAFGRDNSLALADPGNGPILDGGDIRVGGAPFNLPDRFFRLYKAALWPTFKSSSFSDTVNSPCTRIGTRGSTISISPILDVWLSPSHAV